ncbi:MAG: glucose-6-phosphate dehydrogenase [Nitrospiraceae bacterium]|nr:glucose-6-phosphate dehydrogenase [Nitrospiraceae bacterium]
MIKMAEMRAEGGPLRKCAVDLQEMAVKPFTMVIFGGAGDLTMRKLMPGLIHLFEDGELAAGFSVLSFGLPEMDDGSYRDNILGALKQFDLTPSGENWKAFSENLHYLPSSFDDDAGYEKLCRRIEEISVRDESGRTNLIFYMAVPADVMPMIVTKLKLYNLCKGPHNSRIVVEKPFGQDLKSAVELNRILTGAFDECQIFRIDHYLSKEPVRNILFFRFSNFIFEQIWNRNYVDNIQITVAEEIGIEYRAWFYERTGVVRDMVQNHVLQLLGLIAMEPPVGFSADYVRDEKTKVFNAVRIFEDGDIDRHCVRGQYGPGMIREAKAAGYRQEKDVDQASLQNTFFAASFYVDNMRWAGVPFFVRTGKRLARRITEICIEFKQLPLRLFGHPAQGDIEPNILIFTIQPDEKISLRFGVKYPYSVDEIFPVNMVFGYRDDFKMPARPDYEGLLLDCIKGDLSLFVRQDQVEAMWSIVDPVIARWERVPPKDFPNYSAGSWGPREAQTLIEEAGRRWLTT